MCVQVKENEKLRWAELEKLEIPTHSRPFSPPII